MKLKGKAAVVTGSARGIGQGIAECLAVEGCAVVVADIDGDAAETTALAMRDAGAKAIAFTVDVTDAKQIDAMIGNCMDAFGSFDILVNNAGILRANEIGNISEAEWDLVFDTNVKSVFLCCKAGAAHMADRQGGSIVNIASVAGKIGFPGLSHYSASKYAVVGLTNSLGKEFAQKHVGINAICPGFVGTDMWLGKEGLATLWANEGETTEQAWNRFVETLSPQKVPQTAEDMGNMVVFLATNPHIIGQSINICGGYASH